MIIETKNTGISLREIIAQLGNKSYPYIECRYKWTERDGTQCDVFCGSCAYDSKTGELISLDHDSYFLDDLYNEWEEWQDLEEKYFDNEQICLTVWEYGEITDESQNK